LGWDPSESSVIGYKMYYGKTEGDYDYSVDVGNFTSCTISGLEEGATYYFAVTAYNDIGESDYSNEISYTVPLDGTQSSVGNETVFSSRTTLGERRAMPFTMPEDGTIESVTIYHEGGSGKMILAVYDGQTLPDNRLAVTAQTAVQGFAGWQTIELTTPVFIPAGTRIWLGWVFENNPGIRYKAGSPGRAQSDHGWSGGMPDPFGASSQSDYVYSIYATYSSGGGVCNFPPSSETGLCTDGADNDCDGITDCTGVDCEDDPACNCGEKKSPCTENSDCCSNRCSNKRVCL
jgi:hypothetical protein